MFTSLKLWLTDIVEYFRFVHFRKIDHRFGVLPELKLLLPCMVLFAAIIYLLFLFLDPIVLEWIRHPEKSSPMFFKKITYLGNVDWLLIIAGTIMVILSIFSAKRFTGKNNIIWHRIFLNAYFAFTATMFSGLLGNLFKNLIGRARPLYTPEDQVWLSMPFEHHYEYASFPSGHSTTAGAITVILALLFPRWKWFFLFCGVLVAISRPILGVHFPSDIFAGFVFGGLFVVFYARIFARKRLLFTFDHDGRLVLRGEQWFKPQLQLKSEKGNR